MLCCPVQLVHTHHHPLPRSHQAETKRTCPPEHDPPAVPGADDWGEGKRGDGAKAAADLKDADGMAFRLGRDPLREDGENGGIGHTFE